MGSELSTLAPFAVGIPGTVFVIWVLLKFGSGEWQSKRQCEEQLAIRKESEERAWTMVTEIRADLKESTRVVDKLADAVAALTATVNDRQGTRR